MSKTPYFDSLIEAVYPKNSESPAERLWTASEKALGKTKSKIKAHGKIDKLLGKGYKGIVSLYGNPQMDFSRNPEKYTLKNK